MTQTPTERIVVFPEPLHHSHAGRRVAAVVCLSGALAAAGWTFARDAVARRVQQVDTSAVVREVVGRAARTVASTLVKTVAQSSAAPRHTIQSTSPRQSSGVDAGVNAFADEDYDSAATLLRSSLRQLGTDTSTSAQRVRALTFLGAAELELGNRDSATAAFRQLLTLNPRKAPDSAVFTQPVLDLYRQLRSKQQGVARIATTPSGVALTIIALAPHRLSVGVGRSGGPAAFQLFSGLVSDSVVVTWNGVTPNGTAATPGSYELVLVATPTSGAAPRTVRFPVLLEREGPTGPLHARVPASLPPPDLGGNTR